MELIAPRPAALLCDSWQQLLALRANDEKTWLIIPEDATESDAGLRLSYADLQREATRLARALLATGGSPRRAVVIALDNGPEFCLSYFAVVLAGMIPVAFPPPYVLPSPSAYRERLRSVIHHCEAQFLLTDRDTAEPLSLAALESDASLLIYDVLSTGPNAAHVALPEPPRLDELALIQYTSGTTGNPRAVELTHGNVLHNVHGIAAAAGGPRPDDVALSWLPMFHDMGLIGTFLLATYLGLPLVLLTPREFVLRPELWLWSISRFRVTACAAPNFAFELCTSRIRSERLQGLRLDSWRLAFNGAELVHKPTLDRFHERFNAFGFRAETMYPVYGLAENAVAACFPPPGRLPRFDQVAREELCSREVARPGHAIPDSRTIAAVGVPLPGQSVRVVGHDGSARNERQIGEIQLHGVCVMRGYHKDPDATRDAFTADGWLRTGDRGYIADGELHVLGRIKDMIKRAGQRYDPVDLQSATASVNGVSGNVAAFGIDDERSGTEQLVVVAECDSIDAAEQARIRTSIVRAIVENAGIRPDVVQIVPAHTIPRTTSGKISHQVAKARYTQWRETAPDAIAP